jgi:DNA ligase (NAD+)
MTSLVTMSPSEISALVARLEAANHAYHNGLALLMTDAEYDAAVDALRGVAPIHPFLTKVGAAVSAGDEVPLPIPLPSLNKIKAEDSTLTKWLAKFVVATYHISVKLDGCSALWLPAAGKLYTRGDGMRGRDISILVPHITGLRPSAAAAAPTAIRGELIMRTDSPAIPAGKLARNIVAGALNRKFDDIDTALMAEIRFVAYEVVQPVTLTPEEGFRQLRLAGYEVAASSTQPAAAMTETRLSEIFSIGEIKSPYQLDGIVVAPNVPRPAAWAPTVRNGASVNPTDRVAWKTRLTAQTATTTVRSVEWNVSASGMLIPRVLFDPVVLAGATIGAATGLHGRWISDNAVGPGARIEVRRAGDVIPQIIAVHVASPTGAAMPPAFIWDGDPATAVHIKIAPTSTSDDLRVTQLTHALSELGAENVGPGVVAKLFAAGYCSLADIYAASVADLAARVDGVKAKGAERIWAGLRASQSTWTELNMMVASCTMPRGVGHTKLKPLLSLNADPATWNAAAFKTARPAGLSEKTIDDICAAIPTYLAWRAANPLAISAAPAPAAAPAVAAAAAMTVVFTGARDKELEAALAAAGHTVAAAVSKKTTHVAYPDGPSPTSSKITKAQELGVQLITVSALRATIGL